MSFQKCPKCNGEGKVKDMQDNPHWSEDLMFRVPAFIPIYIPCPLCLGEFVIHEEQGVPPSKVITYIKPPDPELGDTFFDMRNSKP